MSDVAHSAGSRLGRYELLRRLGSGGMGDVWQATLHGPSGFRKPVALKILKAKVASRQGRDALIQEARLGAMLQHPNVVGTLDLAPTDGGWAIAMELVKGASLSDLVRGGPLPVGVLLDVGAQACAGLQHIHALRVSGKPAGLVHRDIKPQNLLVDQTGVLKVADLGVARLRGSATGVAGTPGYMPPEQLDGEEEARSDVFALGVTLFALATGRRPFGGGASAMIKVRQADRLIRAPGFFDEVDQSLAGLGQILRRCLRADPSDRWPGAVALGTALKELAQRAPPGPHLLELLARARPDLDVDTTGSGLPMGSDQETRLVARGNLPAERDRFFGRRSELTELATRIEDRPGLITLMGPGGMGKTRLAVQAARQLERELSGGAWFFDLSEATTTEGACAAVSTGLGVRLDRASPVDQLGWALHAKGRAVLVFDNLEQVTESAAALLSRWRDMAPEATFVATSRVALRISGEERIALGPLETAEAVELFVDRAPTQPPDEDLPHIQGLVTDLEGMPLAIELAAARLRLISVTAIRERLSQRLRLLTGGARDRPGRQRSLRASLDGSWELLTPWARSALAQLSVFEGGFDANAAEAVLDLTEWPDAGWALDVLTELVDASLVRVDATTSRFTMLVVIQDYGAEQLSPDVGRRARERHGAFFAQLGGDEALAALHMRGGHERIAALLTDIDNVVAACRDAVARGDAETAAHAARAAAEGIGRQGPVGPDHELLTLALTLPQPPEMRVDLTARQGVSLVRKGNVEEGLARLQAALAASSGTSAVLRGRIHTRVALAMARLGRNEDGLAMVHEAVALLAPTQAHADAALAFSERAGILNTLGRHDDARLDLDRAIERFAIVGSAEGEARVSSQWGQLALSESRLPDAKRHMLPALAIHRRIGNRHQEARALVNLGIICAQLGETSEARSAYESCLQIVRSAGDRAGEGLVLGNLGALARDTGRLDEAERRLTEALAIHQGVSDRRLEGVVLSNLGVTSLDRGRHEAAQGYYRRALEVHREVGNRRSEGIALAGLASAIRHGGDLEGARARFEEALAIHRSVNNLRFMGITTSSLADLARAQGDFETSRAHYEAALALHQRSGNRRFEALMNLYIGRLDRLEGHLDAARERIETALPMLHDIEDPRSQASANASLAEIAWQQGLPDEAGSLVDAVLHEPLADAETRFRARLVNARVIAARGGDAVRELTEVGAPLEGPSDQCLWQLARAEVLRVLGDPAGAEAALAAAHTLATEDDAPQDGMLLREWRRLGGRSP